MFSDVISKIKEKKNILICGHISPDGDAVGSAMALTLMIDSYNKKNYQEDSDNIKNVRVFFDDELPSTMKSFKHINYIENYSNFHMKDIDLIICVDSANEMRIGRIRELLDKYEVINIDHHISNSLYGDINIVEKSSSTCEMMYDLSKEWGIELDEMMSYYLYYGIISDTGNFSYSSVTPKTFQVASDLKKILGDKTVEISDIYNHISEVKSKIIGKTLMEKTYIEDKKFAYIYIDNDYLKDIKAENDDTEGLAELLLKIGDTEVALFIKNIDDKFIKGSLRSKNIDVNKIAALFMGGGHKNAAGFKTHLKPNEIIEKVKNSI